MRQRARNFTRNFFIFYSSKISAMNLMKKRQQALHVLEVKVIFAVVKQLKRLPRKPRKNSEASTGFETMTSAIPVRCSATN